MSAELSDADAELAYVWLPDGVRADVEVEAWDYALSETDDEIVERLEAANADDDSTFAWDDLYVEKRDRGRDEWDLIPLTGTEPDSAVRDDAKEVGWSYVEGIREEVRALQESTAFGPRVWLGYVLSETHLTQGEAASLMDVAEGTLSSWLSRDVSDAIDEARATMEFAEQLENADG